MKKMTIANDNTEYGTLEYWEKRYAQEPGKSFDWFKNYESLKDIFNVQIPDRGSAKIIMLGCGNSTLSQDMYADGYKNILNVDFSPIVITEMRQRCADCPEMKWEVMDIMNLNAIADQSLDIAIDKGTMDALMCEKGDVWEPSEKIVNDVKMEVDEVVRILKPGGKFIYITFGQPHFRRRHLERHGVWDLEIQRIGEAFHYFIYIMTKK